MTAIKHSCPPPLLPASDSKDTGCHRQLSAQPGSSTLANAIITGAPGLGLNVKRGNGRERGLMLSRSVGQQRKDGAGRDVTVGNKLVFFFLFLADILSGSYYREL